MTAKPDKYTATWVSHSSMGDFEKCPRLYYLRALYKNPKTGKKVTTVAPALSLGVSVHEVLEGLAQFPSEVRLDRDLHAWFDQVWQKVHGKVGGFRSEDEEHTYKVRGDAMIETVVRNPRFLRNKIVKLPKGTMNPNFYLSEVDNIILNGLIDWIEYVPETDSLHIIDFKTGKKEEKETSLQLPIYMLLCDALQKRPVTKASYWYLETDVVVEKALPQLSDSRAVVLEKARAVAHARARSKTEGISAVFACTRGEVGCIHCRDMERVARTIAGEEKTAEYVGMGSFGQEQYFVA